MTTYIKYGQMLTQTAKRLHAARKAGWGKPSPGRLAAEFTRVLREWLGVGKLYEIAKLNKKLPKDICASHDFCDSNMAMLQAWSKLTRTPEDRIPISEQWAQDIINEAWAIAKLFDFRLEFDEATNSEGDMVPAFGVENNQMFIVNLFRSECGRFGERARYYRLTKAAGEMLDKLNAGRDVL